ncbi:MAG: hypothetical protein DMG41_37605 [Acidobacteria bacterium]|nr:MAG: hypothetical protein DMG41_37605 [Acidobacteriota bacterium]
MYVKISCFLLACLTFKPCCPRTPTVLSKDTGDDQTCTVSGIVIRSQDSASLKNATVQLANDSDQEHHIATKTAPNLQRCKQTYAFSYPRVLSHSVYSV